MKMTVLSRQSDLLRRTEQRRGEQNASLMNGKMPETGRKSSSVAEMEHCLFFSAE